MKSNSSLTAYLAALPVQDRVAARSKSVPSPLEAWLWGLSAWGQLVQTRAGYALAIEAFSQWKTFLTQSPDQNWPEAVCLENCWKQFQVWIDTRDHTSFTELKTLQPELAQFLNIVDLNIAEGVRPEEPYWAALVCSHAISVALWDTAQLPSGLSQPEYDQRLRAGPAFDLLEAAFCAKKAFGWTDEQIRACIAQKLSEESPGDLESQ
ncbi:MAG TPA: hypothetical protein PLB18_14035 [Acidobacteriota bacterium]|nr:hypothetical protein [Acidobacteriota bacterium]